MKTTITLIALTLLIPASARAQDGKLNLSFLDRLAAKASDKQEVTLDRQTLNSAGSFLPQSAGAARQIISEMQGIYVRNYEFESDNAYTMDDINAIRKQLSAPGWMKIVSNEEKRRTGGFELQEVYLFQANGKIGGLVVISAEPRELSVVNIVGPIDFSKLGALGGVLGIPKVGDSLK